MLPRLCEGGTAVCLASGPSLTVEDVEYVRGKATVIAINDTVRLAPWADVLYSSDKHWWLRHYKAMRAFPGLKVRVHNGLDKPAGKPTADKHCPGCRLRLGASGCWCAGIVTLNNAGSRGLSLRPDAICHGDNSGTAAINLSVLLGAKRIVLLGYDMETYKGRRHFYDTEPQACSSVVSSSTATLPFRHNEPHWRTASRHLRYSTATTSKYRACRPTRVVACSDLERGNTRLRDSANMECCIGAPDS